MGASASTTLKINNIGKVTVLAVSQLPCVAKTISMADKDNYIRPYVIDDVAGTLQMELLTFPQFLLKLNYLTEEGVVKMVEIFVTEENRAMLIERVFHLET
jgi:hypothetical protein